MIAGERAARLRSSPGRLGRWCVVIERLHDEFRRAEQESSSLAHSFFARLVRLFFEFLVLVLIALAELNMVWRRAGSALATRPRR